MLQPSARSTNVDWPIAIAVGGGLLACASLGAVAASTPVAALAALAGLAVVALLVWSFRRLTLRSAFCLSAFALVGGYIVLNRGFAGLYLPLGSLPLYVGEIALVLLLPVALWRLRHRADLLKLPAILLVVWMAFNAVLTLPHLTTFGIDAIRDAAIWYYGLYAFVGAAAWQSMDVTRVRRWFVPIFLLAFAALPASLAQAAGILPTYEPPLGDGPLIGMKWDIATMFLLGAVGLFLTGSGVGNRRQPWPRWSTPILVGVAFLLIALPQHRATFIGLAAVLGLLVFFRLWKTVALTILGTIVALAVLWAIDVQTISMRGMVSTRDVVERQLSTLTFLTGENTSISDDNNETVVWRTIWWGALWQEALDNRVILLVGRGYGPDLRDAVAGLATQDMNWEQNVDIGRPVRSPHSIGMTMLGRSGLIGLGLWVLLYGVGYLWLTRATFAARANGDRDNELFGVWLLTYLVAIPVVSMFGVILESPAGAVPFFFLFGLGVAWAQDQLALRKTAPAPARPALVRRSPTEIRQAFARRAL